MEIAVLGPLELRGRAVPGARLGALVVLLALEAGRVVSADRLIDGVWGDEPPAAAGNALQALVSRLRRAAPELVVEATPHGYRLVVAPEQVDAHVFVGLVTADPAAALRLWRGDLEFPEAAQAEAVHLEQLRLLALKQRIAGELGSRDVVPEVEGLLAARPLDESLVALLMRALRAVGNPGRALAAYESFRVRLADELGADPSPELRELHLDLLRGEKRRGNLPAEVSSFVGRESDVSAVRRLVETHRLVTLLGPGGSGKTRLSVEAGGKIPGEVWRVELAPVTDPAEIPQAVLTALGLRGHAVLDRPGQAARTGLREALAGRTMLLILDNCEHLIGPVAEVADELLRAAPGLTLLTTSREPLGIAGERLHPVEPLALPPVGAGASTAAGFPAVRLLLDRAASFALTEENAPAVVRVCRALDGMPLAIELAAARLRTLPVTVLADRLTDRFRLLTGGSRTALPRHQTLRAVVDWSWDLLAEPERRLWRRFALFQGGADLAATELVCDTDVDTLAALVDKSLLVLGPDGRYRMLETIREYGLERLTEAGENESQRLAVARWLLELAGTADPHLRRPEQLVWLSRLAVEHDNLIAAVRAAIEAGDRATAAALVARLGWYWWLSGHRPEGAVLAAAVAGMPGDADGEDIALAHTYAAINGLEGGLPVDRVEADFRAAQLLTAGREPKHPALRLIPALAAIFDEGGHSEGGFAVIEPLFDDPDPWLRSVAKMFVSQLRLNFGHGADVAEAEMREALAGFRGIGERWGIGFALSSLGDMAAAKGDFVQAVSWQREAIALVREVGIREDLPQMEVKLGHQLWLAGEVAEARAALKQARQGAEEVALPEVTASVAYGTATFARMEGDLSEARRCMDMAVEMMRHPAAMPQFKAMAMHTQGLIDAAAGDLVTARRSHTDAVRMAVESRDSPVIALTLVGLADLELREGNPERAAFLLGASDAVRGSRDLSVPDVERITFEARAALGDAGFDEAYRRAAGTTMFTAADLL
ncbi:BTAD domain-containing putative transcriptional regulator [Paractinoplanes lichenicola]|uniref:Winged helix-turn-helix domain-containing protein n=1 Tax=Paractinoplanes lichenicola TaxID=2802976 RepID=A0ABS1VNU7_9ACTN|nr:BTAD domain-containing putative transcriptional regulator [Actinoplanes lichenicola]MBL7256412.1 winged helix-turn-helix domain-containing protein [Actinoplanes lichenicola]